MPGCRGASSGGRGGGGSVGDRIRGLGVSGRGGGGKGLKDPYHMGGGGVATRNTGPYIFHMALPSKKPITQSFPAKDCDLTLSLSLSLSLSLTSHHMVPPFVMQVGHPACLLTCLFTYKGLFRTKFATSRQSHMLHDATKGTLRRCFKRASKPCSGIRRHCRRVLWMFLYV